MSDCLFCNMAAGKVKCDEVHSDADLIAFHDINPQGPVHILIVPRRHIANLSELQDADAELMGRLLVTAGRLASNLGQAAEGYRCVINCGAAACQSVDHLHIHLIAGRQLGWPPG